jgi:hypothetical protein
MGDFRAERERARYGCYLSTHIAQKSSYFVEYIVKIVN